MDKYYFFNYFIYEKSQGGMGDAPKPTGMSQIMNMLSNGQMPDDIKEVDDKPQPFNPETKTETSVTRQKVNISFFFDKPKALVKQKRGTPIIRQHNKVKNQVFVFLNEKCKLCTQCSLLKYNKFLTKRME